jgi:hypothetical protein
MRGGGMRIMGLTRRVSWFCQEEEEEEEEEEEFVFNDTWV